MIWKNGLTEEAKRKIRVQKRRLAIKEWHKWFAWYPVIIRIENDHNIKAWMQYVERKTEYFWPTEWEYRERGLK
jgi:hypothetical protein